MTGNTGVVTRKLLIVAATRFELAPMLKELGEGRQQGPELWQYQWHRTLADVLITGVGMMLTAFHLGRYLATHTCDMAVNAGIAGAYTRDFQIGEVVEVVRDNLPELGVQEGHRFLTLKDLGLSEAAEFPFTGARMVNEHAARRGPLEELRKVTGNTVNTIRSDPEGIRALRNRTGADVESMEGAAFLHACLMAEIPSIQLRAVSNYVDVRDKTQWNVPLAIENLNKKIMEILTDHPISR